MLSRILMAAGLAALTAPLVNLPARAADLDGYPRYGYNDRYDDDRYGDRRAEPPYYDRQLPPPRGSLKDDDLPSQAPSYPPRESRTGCVVNGEVRPLLVRQGWSDFRPIEIFRNLAVLDARRPDGLFYRLQVDRCTGVIVSAVLIQERPGGWAPPRGYYGPRGVPSY